MKFLVRALPVAAFALPTLAFAQGAFFEVSGFIDNITLFINNTLVPLVFAIAFLVFLWGVAQFFIIGRDAEEAKEKGKEYMLWAIGGFVVMVSIWGIVNLLVSALNLDHTENLQDIPNAPTTNN